MNIKAPRRLPTLADMIRDLEASPREVGHALDVSESTVYRWVNVGTAPRAPMLALYWLTRWGRSDIDAELWNRATVYQGLAQAMERELWAMQQDIQRLGQIGDYGSANDPVSQITRRFGLDGAGTFKAMEPTAHATISHSGTEPRFVRSRR